MDGEEDFIQMPFVAGSGTPAPELIGIGLPELQAPFADRFIGHEDPAGEQQLFHITVAQAEAEVEPDAMADDLGRKPMVFVRVG